MEKLEYPSYYAIIPANIRYCKELKFQERLFYGEITCLLNKYGYCFASNRYFADLYNVIPGTISRWISHLEKLGFISVEIIRDKNKQIIERRIYIKESRNTINLDKTYKQNCLYPYEQNKQESISKSAKDNNINIKIDRLFKFIISKKGNLPNEFKSINEYNEFYKFIIKLEFNYKEDMITSFTKDNLKKVKTIIYCILDIYKSNRHDILNIVSRKELIETYDYCKRLENKNIDTDNKIINFYDYFYASIIKNVDARLS